MEGPGAGEGARPQDVLEVGSLENGQDNTKQPPAEGPASLIAEWLALPELSANLARRLADLGVGRDAIRRAGGLSASRIHQIGRTFTPAGYGRLHLVLPVWAGPAPNIFEAVERPVLLDLLAWHPDNAELWLYRIGAAGLILGEDRYLEALRSCQPFRAFATPLEWLQADCHGAVFLDDAERRWRGEAEEDHVDAIEAWAQRIAP